MDTLAIDCTVALRSFRLELSARVERETLALVGPSGAGKTSALRAAAGLLRPGSGRITLGDRVWFDAATGIDRRPEERSVGYVFQEYALFPHLSVSDNVAFGGRTRARELLERFSIAHLANTRPGSLSGGERQRVALARALARDPQVLLLDEPLAALDVQTRDTVRAELRSLLAELSLPTVLVTHDFEDAAALADRVGVLVDGRVLQSGAPSELVAAPASAFVAQFAGANVVNGKARPSRGGLTAVTLGDGSVVFSTDVARGEVSVIVYPWDISVARKAASDSTLNHVAGPIESMVRLGNRVRARVGIFAAEVTASSARRLDLRERDVVIASFKATATRLLPR
jgi:ABC-type sulfate/molybdate transport systems ATPase subunit